MGASGDDGQEGLATTLFLTGIHLPDQRSNVEVVLRSLWTPREEFLRQQVANPSYRNTQAGRHLNHLGLVAYLWFDP